MNLRTILALTALALPACGGGGSIPSAPMPAMPISSPVAPLKVAVVGDSISHGATEVPEPGNPPYPTILAGMGFAVQNLGINGEKTLAMVTDEVPQIDPSSQFVVIETGTNDALNPPYNVADFDALVSAVKARAPQAHLVVVTVRDYSLMNLTESAYVQYLGGTAATVSSEVRTWNAHVRIVAANAGATVLDIESAPQWFVAGDWVLPEGVHPLVGGATKIANALALLL